MAWAFITPLTTEDVNPGTERHTIYVTNVLFLPACQPQKSSQQWPRDTQFQLTGEQALSFKRHSPNLQAPSIVTNSCKEQKKSKLTADMKHNCHPILPRSRSPKCRRATRRCLLKTHLLGSTPDLGNQTLQNLPFKKVPGNLTHVTLRTTALALREPEGHQYYRMRLSQRTFWEHSKPNKRKASDFLLSMQTWARVEYRIFNTGNK